MSPTRYTLTILAVAAALAPAGASAQPGPGHDGGRYTAAGRDDFTCQATGCTHWRRPPPPRRRYCCRPPHRDPAPPAWLHDGRGYRQGYYRDYFPAPQYGYTYGSARGRGYGYSYGDYGGPPPYPGGW